MLKGAFLHQTFDGLGACAAAPIAKLPGMSAKPAPQAELRLVHVRVRLLMVDRQRLDCGSCTLLGHLAGIRDDAFKLLAMVSGEGLHAGCLLFYVFA